jgi:hypothetical protein
MLIATTDSKPYVCEFLTLTGREQLGYAAHIALPTYIPNWAEIMSNRQAH